MNKNRVNRSRGSRLRWPMTIMIAVGLLAVVTAQARQSPANRQCDETTVVVHITTGPDNMLAISSALNLAIGALEAERRVVVLFDAGGVNIPKKSLPHDVRLIDRDSSVRDLVQELIKSGAVVLATRKSMDHLGLVDNELFSGVRIIERSRNVFSAIPQGSVVFSY